MNSFLFSAITICLAAQCALAQYQNAGYQQRKMAPAPQQYGHQQMASYGGGADQHEQVADYRAPSSASVSHYDERTPAASYQAARPAYAAPKTTYAAPAAYAKPAPKYEEPYVSILF